MLSKTSVWRYFDVWLFAAVLLLTAYGIVMIRSAVTGAPDLLPLPADQVRWAIIGTVLLLVVAAIDYRIFTSAHWYIYGFLIFLLVVVVVGGQIGNDARRWIPLPGGLQIQPSEFGRIFIAITFAQFLTNRRHLINRFSNTLLTLVYFGIPIGLIFIQPNLGMTVLFLFIWFVMIWLAGLPLTHFLLLGLVGAIAIVSIFPFLADYQKGRITVFLDPEGASADDVFNVDQAEISIGTGGWEGKGYGEGTQSQLGFLRVQHTDFIFAMLTEEMGMLFGSIPVLGLIGFILYRILRAASRSPDPAGKLLSAGIAAIIFFQTFVSVGMNVRILPVTGLTLPFVSYGGSSLITLFLAVGIVESVLMRQRKQEFG